MTKDYTQDFKTQINFNNPMIFIEQLKDYLERYKITDWNKIKGLIDLNLTNNNSIKEWWTYIKNDIKILDDFIEKIYK